MSTKVEQRLAAILKRVSVLSPSGWYEKDVLWLLTQLIEAQEHKQELVKALKPFVLQPEVDVRTWESYISEQEAGRAALITVGVLES